jgi:succinate dehydrogenase hydrophobic anchor subunit
LEQRGEKKQKYEMTESFLVQRASAIFYLLLFCSLFFLLPPTQISDVTEKERARGGEALTLSQTSLHLI